MSDQADYHDAGIHPNDGLDDVARTLEDAAHQMQAADILLIEAEKNQHTLIEHVHRLLKHLAGSEEQVRFWKSYAEIAEQDRDQWKKRADALEVERNQWVSEWGELKTALQKSRRLCAELGIKTGESRCPECGSRCLALLHGMFPTGVESPDGVKEAWYECAVHCQDCGYVEEVT